MTEAGRLHLYFLSVGGERVAFLYLLAGGDSLYAYQTGFDRAWSKMSVGFVLLGMVIERGIAEGVAVLEFLRGAESYKYDWRVSGTRQLVDVIVPGNSMSARLYDVCRRGKRAATAAVRCVAPHGMRRSIRDGRRLSRR
jgi:CelD/BcsL family acetyltransferase involved in cellulose biosynthesis